jgi:hypothetical protein
VEYFQDCDFPAVDDQGVKGGLNSGDEHWTDRLVALGIPEYDVVFLCAVLTTRPNEEDDSGSDPRNGVFRCLLNSERSLILSTRQERERKQPSGRRIWRHGRMKRLENLDRLQSWH